MRDKRWDYLYDRQKQPVKAFILERFIAELAEELRAWPPPFVDWVSDDLRRRYAAGLEITPPERVLRFALRIAKLELEHEPEAIDRLMQVEVEDAWQTPQEKAAGHLLVQFIIEKMYALKEHAEGAKIRNADLAEAVPSLERALFMVILGA